MWPVFTVSDSISQISFDANTALVYLNERGKSFLNITWKKKTSPGGPCLNNEEEEQIVSNCHLKPTMCYCLVTLPCKKIDYENKAFAILKLRVMIYFHWNLKSQELNFETASYLKNEFVNLNLYVFGSLDLS